MHRTIIKHCRAAWTIMRLKLGMLRYDQLTQSLRQKICEGCQQNDFGICTVCECVLYYKTRDPKQHCPRHKW